MPNYRNAYPRLPQTIWHSLKRRMAYSSLFTLIMKTTAFIIGLLAGLLYLICPHYRYTTTIKCQQTYSGGLVDTIQMTIPTEDSLGYAYFWDDARKESPQGRFCFISLNRLTRQTDKHYLNPQIAKIRVLRAFSLPLR